jgi:hypothetical protein
MKQRLFVLFGGGIVLCTLVLYISFLNSQKSKQEKTQAIIATTAVSQVLTKVAAKAAIISADVTADAVEKVAEKPATGTFVPPTRRPSSVPNFPRPHRDVNYEELLQTSLAGLKTGEFFHTVPTQMTADKSVLIEAGIAQKVTEKLLDDLDIKERDKVQIRKDVKYDPLGVELKLDVDNDMLKVRDITTGLKPIVSKSPEKWVWEVTPLRRGRTTITILAIVELNVPEIGKSYKRKKIVFKEEREVQINFGYSTSKFITDNWKEASGFVFGSGSIAGLIKWLLDQRKDKLKSEYIKK